MPTNSESALLKAVANQPISVAIDGSGSDFQFYSSSVFPRACSTELDHGVTVIDSGTADDGTKYWLVKNSWEQVGVKKDAFACREILMQRKASALQWLLHIPLCKVEYYK